MQTIVLQPIPNQSFTTTVEGNLYDVGLKYANGIMACDMTRNGTVLFTGLRCVANSPLIPYRYMESGNFMFATSGSEEIPDYTAFGTTQSLLYLSKQELLDLRAAKLVFSPLGKLPLRYKPQGYRIAP